MGAKALFMFTMAEDGAAAGQTEKFADLITEWEMQLRFERQRVP